MALLSPGATPVDMLRVISTPVPLGFVANTETELQHVV